MELQALFKREGVADLFSKTYANSPLPSKIMVAHTLFRDVGT